MKLSSTMDPASGKAQPIFQIRSAFLGQFAEEFAKIKLNKNCKNPGLASWARYNVRNHPFAKSQYHPSA